MTRQLITWDQRAQYWRRNRVYAQLHFTIYVEIRGKLEKERSYERVPQSVETSNESKESTGEKLTEPTLTIN